MSREPKAGRNAQVAAGAVVDAGGSSGAAPIELHKRTGLPLRAEDWTEEDWLDLHRAIKRVTKKIARRHRRNVA